MPVKNLAIGFFTLIIGFNIISICYLWYFQTTEIVISQGSYNEFTIGDTKTQILEDEAHANTTFSPWPKTSPQPLIRWYPHEIENHTKKIFMDSQNWIVSSNDESACPDLKKCSRTEIVFSEDLLEKIRISCERCQ